MPGKMKFIALLITIAISGIVAPDLKTYKFNIYFPEEMLLKYKGKAYVRVYQAVYDQATGASTANYPPSNSKFKDIFQDKDENIIIYPDGGDVGKKAYYGVGDYRNQLKAISGYKSPSKKPHPADNPLIKSFIVSYDTFYNDILKHVKSESKSVNKESNNVDPKFSNQFGLNRCHADILRMKALPGTLVTMAEKEITGPKDHLGLVKVISSKELKELWVQKNIPDHEEKDDPQGTTVDLLSEAKAPRALNMAKVPEIIKDEMETGITDRMFTKNTEFNAKWKNARRFLGIIKSFTGAIAARSRQGTPQEATLLKEIKKINEKDIFRLLYGNEEMLRKIEGGFLVGVDDFNDDQSNKLLDEVIQKLVDDRMKLEAKDKDDASKLLHEIMKKFKDKHLAFWDGCHLSELFED